MITSTPKKFGATLLLSVVLLTGIYSCDGNKTTEEKKVDSAAIIPVDTTMKSADTSKKLTPSDAVQPSDTGRDIKVPKPTR